MHITEGIITGLPALAFTVAGGGLVGYGAVKMKAFVKEHPEKKPLLGMAGAFIFFLSLVPIPAFFGTTSHPCGSPLAGILFGPWIGIALSGLSLILQAAFFAHGGFSTWGANVITLGVGGAFFGWATFRICRRMGLSLLVAAALGGLIGDIMAYVLAGLSLSAVLSIAPHPQFTFTGYLVAIYAAYLPTQGPIAIGEMFITGFMLKYIYDHRPEILESLKVVSYSVVSLLIVGFLLLFPVNEAFSQEVSSSNSETINSLPEKKTIIGMDEAVNEGMAISAGLPPRDPYINLEALGDVWNAVMLLGGAICGFIFGRYWHLISGGEKKNEQHVAS